MRALGVDFGQRRIGLALSDATGTLARPWMTMNAGQSPIASADALTRLIHDTDNRRDHDLEDLSTIVVGVPRRLNGEDTQQTRPAREFARRLQQAFPDIRVVEQDER